MTDTYVALVPAAGSGERLGAKMPKALVEVAGKSLLRWGLEALAAAQGVSEILVAAPPGQRGWFEELRREWSIDRWTLVVVGGETRAESVASLVSRASGTRVLVHDAARPCITGGFVDALIAELGDDPAGVPALPLRDTLKRAVNGMVTATVPRDGLHAVQTPQLFDRELLCRAHAARNPDAEVTDDAMLLEAMGVPVRLLEGRPENVKVTYPADLDEVRRTLEAREGRR
jgi:2-C-methyl-D-erythritol 4-phosphate cytidylyltransferase